MCTSRFGQSIDMVLGLVLSRYNNGCTMHTVNVTYQKVKPLTGVSSDATLSPLPSVVTSVCGGCVRGGSASG